MAPTNHDSSVILFYFLKAVQRLKGQLLALVILLVNITGCPSVLQMDKQTENVKVAATQYAFREGQNDAFAGNGSIRFGTSPANIVHTTSL